MLGEPTFPVRTVETLARFSFPFFSMLIWKTFMPKQTHETNIEGRRGNNQYVFSRNDQVYARAYYPDPNPNPNPNKLLADVLFSGSVSPNYDRDCSSLRHRSTCHDSR